MVIKNLIISNFRNIKNLRLDFSDAGLLIYGKNGSGKTNLLEAISYFSFGKSFRYLSDNEIIKFGENDFYLEADFNIYKAIRNIKIKSGKEKKVIRIDGNVLKKTTDLYKFVKIVFFSPSDINIAIGYPINRRRFFDIAISQYDFGYLENLKQYNRILKQRNALLKKNYTDNEKNIWDKQFVKIAKDVIVKRLKYLELFNKEMSFYYKKIAKGKEEAKISYHPDFSKEDNEITRKLFQSVKEKENDEKTLQRTLFGPHLHDYKFFLNGLSIKKFGSQGQKRSFVIALRLSQAKLIDISGNDSSILIFDDVLSELDAKRSENIFDLLGEKHQIFIATPNKQNYNSLNINAINLEEILNGNETE